MPRFLPDTNCMIAVSSSWHEHHRRAAQEVGRRLDQGENLVLAAHTLVETYAVLTRLPPRFRLSPFATLALLTANFTDVASDIVALTSDDYRLIVQSGPARQVSGGAIYDALIFACARQARADALLTFNERHFRPFTGQGIEIVVPP